MNEFEKQMQEDLEFLASEFDHTIDDEQIAPPPALTAKMLFEKYDQQEKIKSLSGKSGRLARIVRICGSVAALFVVVAGTIFFISPPFPANPTTGGPEAIDGGEPMMANEQIEAGDSEMAMADDAPLEVFTGGSAKAGLSSYGITIAEELPSASDSVYLYYVPADDTVWAVAEEQHVLVAYINVIEEENDTDTASSEDVSNSSNYIVEQYEVTLYTDWEDNTLDTRLEEARLNEETRLELIGLVTLLFDTFDKYIRYLE